MERGRELGLAQRVMRREGVPGFGDVSKILVLRPGNFAHFVRFADLLCLGNGFPHQSVCKGSVNLLYVAEDWKECLPL